MTTIDFALAPINPDAGSTAKTRTPGQLLDGVSSALGGINQEELQQEFTRAFIETEIRKVPGLGSFRIPNQRERALQEREIRVAEAEISIKESEIKTRQVVGLLLDRSAELEPQLDTRLDQSILDDPERLILASMKLAKLLNRPEDPGIVLSNSDLLNFQFTREAASKTVEERGAETVSRQIGAARDLEGLAERQEQAKEGEGPLAQLFARTLGAQEEAFDVDLEPAGFLGDDDLDTALGSERFLFSVFDTAERLQRLGQSQDAFFDSVLQGDFGKRIVSELNDIEGDTLQVVDEPGIAPQAIANFMILLDEVSRRTNVPVETLMQRTGLKFTKFNRNQAQAAKGLLARSRQPQG